MRAPSRRFWLLLVALLSGCLWLLFAPGGWRATAAALEYASAGRLVIDGAQGRLVGPLALRQLSYAADGKRYRLRDVRLDWSPRALLAGRLEIATLAAASVELLLPPSASPAALPAHLRLPLAVRVDSLEIGVLELSESAAAAPRRLAGDIRATLSGDAELHRLDALSLQLDAGRLQAQATLGATAPFALHAAATLDTRAAPSLRLAARAAGTLAAVELAIDGHGAGFSATAQARLRPFAVQPLAALHLAAQGVDPRVFMAQAPRARLTLSADLDEDATGALGGRLDLVNAAPAPFDRGGLPFSRIAAGMLLRLDAEARVLRLDDLLLTLGTGGTASGQADLSWPAAAALPQGAAELTLHRLDPAALHSVLRHARLDGRVVLAGDAATQRATLGLGDGTQRLDARLLHQGERIELADLRLTRGAAELAGAGELRLDAARSWRFAGKLRRFDIAAFARLPRSDLNVEFDGSGHLVPGLDGRLRFALAASKFDGQALSGRGDVSFAGLDDAAALLAANGQAQLRGDIALHLADSHLQASGGWGGPDERLQLSLRAPTLARHGHGLAGALDLTATLAGAPGRLDIALAATARRLVLPGGHALDRLDARGRLQGQALEFSLSAEDYRQDGAVRLDALELAATGTRARHQVRGQARLAGARTVELGASGALHEAVGDGGELAWAGTLDSLTVSGALPWRLLAPATLSASRRRIALGAASLAFADGRIDLAESTWTPQAWTTRGRFGALALRPGGSGQGTNPLRLGGAWSLAGAGGLDGWLRVERESGDWMLPGDLSAPLALGLETLRLDAQASAGRLRAEFAAAGSRIGRWQASATLPLGPGGAAGWLDRQAPLDGRITAAVPSLAWLGPALDANLVSAGALALDIALAGSLAAPELLGHLDGSDLAISFIDQNVGLRDGRLKLRLARETVHIEQFEFVAPHDPPAVGARVAGLPAQAAPGKLGMVGSFDLRRRSASLVATLARVPLMQTPQRWVVASGTGRIDYGDAHLRLGAELRADAGYIAQGTSDRPQLAADVVVLGRARAVRRGPSVDSDISLDLGEHFHLRAAGLAARLAGRLRVRGGAGGALSATGSIATQDATFDAYGQHLTVDRGIVNFQGPLDDPGLNVQAMRRGLAVEAGVTVSGTMQHPQVRLISVPPVPDAEKLSWIVLGRAPDAGGTDASLLLAAAGSILGGEGEGIGGQLARTLGVDELSLRPVPGGDALDQQLLTAGKRLSARTFLSYEQGLNAASGVVKLSYALTPRISVVTRAGEDSAIDVFYSISFD